MNGETLRQTALRLKERENPVVSKKMEQLAGKWESDELQLAFCGHFSAGKSTLINRLCGHSLLPSSPIPTSANVVTIRNGEAAARIYQSAEAGVREIPLEELDEACRNGEQIESVEIRYPIPLLGGHAALLDTPGIDSTDEAHMQATESALHMADVVFYVMDYNHVMSEMNFTFAARLKEWGKPLYLIVNQIDKHNEQELPFDDYRNGVAEAFKSWNINVDGILYLSLKQPDHPHHEWRRLVGLVRTLIEGRNSLIEWNVARSAEQVLREYMNGFRAVHEQVREQLNRELEGSGAGETLEAYREAEAELARLAGLSERESDELVRRCQSILDNANVIPAATRDLAQLYLETRRPGFKVGWLGSAAKKEQERARRLDAFHDHFSEQVRSQLQWHIETEWKKTLDRLGLPSNLLEEEAVPLGQGVTPDWLAERVAPGAVVSGEYTLNYSKQIAADVKALYRRYCLEAAERLKTALAPITETQSAHLKQQLEQLEAGLAGYRRLEALDAQEKAEEQTLRQTLGTSEAEAALQPPSLPLLSSALEAAAGLEDATSALSLADSGEAKGAALSALSMERLAEASGSRSSGSTSHQQKLRDMAQRLRQAEALLEGLPGMQAMRASLRTKAERLANSRFTIALFGAFSAGKSSFANSLIGERLLPVSPNPTTAAINTIVPPTDGRPHGTASVTLKREEMLLGEVRYSLGVLGLGVTGIERLSSALAEVRQEHLSAAAKPHLAFLRAVESGWSAMEPLLGTVVAADQEQFARYVAEEGVSCFVEAIELHYAHPLAEQGIVLVDTPGADSINARHTGVAFNYLKNADAILFVTYYNHAFSQADREFLLQLGRVKDALELDKMFFLVNAADLASSRDELEGVCKHVETNLLQHGIRFPRIYPVSSQLAVQAKLDADEDRLAASGMAAFERDFSRFTFEELGGIALHSAEAELKRAEAMLEDWLRKAAEGEREREEALRSLLAEVEASSRILQGPDALGAAELRKDLDKEVDELLFYVRQRMSFRFGELFNLAFNPSTLREDGRDIRRALESCWQELLRLSAYALSQEVLATTLRIETFIGRTAAKRHQAIVKDLVAKLPALQPAEPAAFEASTPAVEESLEGDGLRLEAKWLAGFFKNGRSFFEGDGKSRLRAELEPMVANVAEAYSIRHADRLKLHYAGAYDVYGRQLLEELQETVNEFAAGQRTVLEMKLDLNELKQKIVQLHALIS